MEEKYLVVVKSRPRHYCSIVWQVIAIIVWEGVQRDKADKLYDKLRLMLPDYAYPSEVHRPVIPKHFSVFPLLINFLLKFNSVLVKPILRRRVFVKEAIPAAKVCHTRLAARGRCSLTVASLQRAQDLLESLSYQTPMRYFFSFQNDLAHTYIMKNVFITLTMNVFSSLGA